MNVPRKRSRKTKVGGVEGIFITIMALDVCVLCVFDFGLCAVVWCGVVVVILFISPHHHFARLFYDYRRDGVRRGGTKTSRYYFFGGFCFFPPLDGLCIVITCYKPLLSPCHVLRDVEKQQTRTRWLLVLLSVL